MTEQGTRQGGGSPLHSLRPSIYFHDATSTSYVIFSLPVLLHFSVFKTLRDIPRSHKQRKFLTALIVCVSRCGLSQEWDFFFPNLCVCLRQEAIRHDATRCDIAVLSEIVRWSHRDVSRALASYCEPAKFERVIVVHVSHIQILS